MDVLEKTGPTSPAMLLASYTIVRGGEKKMFAVDTVRHEYYEFDPVKLAAGARQMMNGMQLKFSDFKIKVEDLGDGETYLGHPTRRWRIRNAIAMSATVGNDTVSFAMEMTSDKSYAKDLPFLMDPEAGSDSILIVQFRDLIPIADASKVGAEMSRLPKTVQMKSISRMITHMGPMDMTTTSMTTVTKIETVKVAPSFFEVPEEYKLVEMPNLIPPEIKQ